MLHKTLSFLLQVHVQVSVDQGLRAAPCTTITVDPARHVVLRVLVRNRAKATRPKLSVWRSGCSPTAPAKPRVSGASLSSGLGLEHMRMVADVSGITAQLWQEDDTVFFEARKTVDAADPVPEAGSTDQLEASLLQTCRLTITCLDDSAVARRTLENAFEQYLPNAAVQIFGQGAGDIPAFKRCVEKKCDILVTDQHLDFPGDEMLGSDIVRELLEAGYRGLVCIRSGNNAEEDVALYRRAGAHCHIGKEMRMKDMVQLLLRQYALHLQQSS